MILWKFPSWLERLKSMCCSSLITARVMFTVFIRCCKFSTRCWAVFINCTCYKFSNTPVESDTLAAVLFICTLHIPMKLILFLSELYGNGVRTFSHFSLSPIESNTEIRTTRSTGLTRMNILLSHCG